jgi:hypothetical protein
MVASPSILAIAALRRSFTQPVQTFSQAEISVHRLIGGGR